MVIAGIIRSIEIQLGISHEEAGAACLIVNAEKVRPAVLATDLLLGRDGFAVHCIGGYSARLKQREG